MSGVISFGKRRCLSSNDGRIVRWPVLSTRQTHRPVLASGSSRTTVLDASTPALRMDDVKSAPHSSLPTAEMSEVRMSKPAASPRAVFAADPPALVENSPTLTSIVWSVSSSTRIDPPTSPLNPGPALKKWSGTLQLWSITARVSSAITSGGEASGVPSRLRLRCGWGGNGGEDEVRGVAMLRGRNCAALIGQDTRRTGMLGVK